MNTISTSKLYPAIPIWGLALLGVCFSLTANAQSEWKPNYLADGQPDINGMWNNVGATATPLEMPEQFQGRVPSDAEIAEFINARDESRKNPSSDEGGGVGAYGNEWFDWYWSDPEVDAPALIVNPPSGRLPKFTEAAQAVHTYNTSHEHDSAANVESGDRCLSRGVFGMMMPTAYNNGKLFVQSPGYLVIHSEMIHNARIIPIGNTVSISEKIKLWEGAPRGHWEGNTLIVESKNFRYEPNMRAPGTMQPGNAPQHEGRRMIETFTFEGPDTLRYTLTVEDPATYTAPWTVAFPYKRDSDYVQYEYACHEGNYAMINRLSGAREQEKAAR
jgi:hypothetical protein